MFYDLFCESVRQILETEISKQYGNVEVCKELIQGNNGTDWDAIRCYITELNIAPIVYLGPLYEEFRNGRPFHKLIRESIDTMLSNVSVVMEQKKQWNDVDFVKENLVCRLISKKQNEELLRNIPWVPYLDMAVIFSVYFGPHNGQILQSTLTREKQRDLGLSKQELYDLALSNTMRIFPHQLSRMTDEEWEMYAKQFDIPSLYILTNSLMNWGAACMLYPEIWKDISTQLGADLIVLPSSISEVLIIADRDHDEEMYNQYFEMVSYVNEYFLQEQEYLSDSIYLYSREAREVRIWKPGRESTDGTAEVDEEALKGKEESNA